EIGIPYNPDINAPAGTISVSKVMSHINPNGERSPPSAYLPTTVLFRPNLDVLIDTRTTRILFDASHRAADVEIAQSATGERFRVAAGKEVVLSAGAVGTPQILMVSEVEPKRVEKDGYGGREGSPLGCVILRATEFFDYLGTPTLSLLPLVRWMTAGKRPLTSNVAEACAFFRSDDQKYVLWKPQTVQPESSLS
ncbi:hypothetical protein FRC06_005107, partial [Ceratobasidium sp. 370]